MKRVMNVAAGVLTGCLGVCAAHASEPFHGTFTATQECEAFQSFRNGTNPGAVTTEVGRAYQVFEINKAGGDQYRMRIAEAPGETARWVAKTCGTFVADAAGPGGGNNDDDGAGKGPHQPRAESTDNLLTVSWQPAFCETRPSKTECRIIQDGGLQGTETRFSIHGLWPQPRGNDYCGALGEAHEATDRAGDWDQLPAPELSDATREALERLMPGTMSHLDRHEWIKHGTCYFGEGGAEEYYADTLHLVEQLNASPVAALLAGNLNAEVSGEAIRAAFDEAFGDGAGARVEVNCVRDNDSNRRLIGELWIALEGTITPQSQIGDLILAAEPRGMDCEGGIVDPVGGQS